MKPTHIKMLSTGYWHVRFGLNRFVQWSVGTEPILADVFGEPKEEMLQIAARAAWNRRTP